FQNTTYTPLEYERRKSERFAKDKPVILITGGAGFVGINYIHYLLRSHPAYCIRVLDLQASLDRPNGPLETFSAADRQRIEWVPMDLLDPSGKIPLGDVDRVVHLAGQPSASQALKQPNETRNLYLRGT